MGWKPGRQETLLEQTAHTQMPDIKGFAFTLLQYKYVDCSLTFFCDCVYSYNIEELCSCEYVDLVGYVG